MPGNNSTATSTLTSFIFCGAADTARPVLPAVWEQHSTAEEFLLHSRLKAELASDFCSDDLQFATYTVEKS